MTGLWNAHWGDDYHERNPATGGQIAWRIKLWRKVFASANEMPRSFLDVGAGTGANIRAIQHLLSQPEIYAIEPNEKALALLDMDDAVQAKAANIPFADNRFDMAYTYGVLIHIPDSELAQSMKEIYRCSRRWLFCAEYFNPTPIEVPYRGQRDVLWKRDYGSLWLDNFDLQLVAYGFEWKRQTGLDNITWWLLQKSF